MTEAAWHTCADPKLMLDFLRGKVSDRKLRLFVADGVRSLAGLFGDEQVALAEMQERVADGQATGEELERFLLRDMPELWKHRAPGGNLSPVWETACMVVRDRFKLAPREKVLPISPESRASELASVCLSLRCIFGDPFRPVTVDPTWRTPAVIVCAQAAYDEREMTSGQIDRRCLAVLSDALEEAGCTDAALLNHLRSSGPHVRGCWALDMILGKE